MASPHTLASRLQAAEGYFELGMVSEAERELDAISRPGQADVAVVSMRLQILIAGGHYERGEQEARRLVFREPKSAFPWLGWAFCARRAISLDAARQILETARAVHPTNEVIVFNLACYERAAGRTAEARELFSKARELNAAVTAWAAQDEGLRAILDGDPPPP